MNVRDARDVGHLLAEVLGDGQVPGPVDANHLNVDGGGQPEVQDLAGDVRRLEVERAIRDALRQLLPQPGVRGRRGPVVRVQLDEETVCGAYGRATVH